MAQCVDMSAGFVVDDDMPASSSAPGRPLAARAPGAKHHAARSGSKHTPKPAAAGEEAEALDPHKLQQRQKQIDYGKNTIGYQRYIQLVPKESRTKRDPATPEITSSVSKRCFDGQVKVWRRLLHQFDEGMPQHQPAGKDVVKQSDQDVSEGGEDCAASPSSRGSLDGYYAPSAANKKRGHGSAFLHKAADVGADAAAGDVGAVTSDGVPRAAVESGGRLKQLQQASDSCEREAKRSTASRSSLQEQSDRGAPHDRHAPLASTAGTAGHTLGGSVAGGTHTGGVFGVLRPGASTFGGPHAAGKLTSPPHKHNPDNVLSLILGGENGSRMSWAADADDVDELDAVGL